MNERDERGRYLRGASQARRRRGGPPGNLNAARHPYRAYWRRRALRKQDKWVARVVQVYADGLIDDKGGRENMSCAEVAMVELASLARGCTMLILDEAARGSGIAGQRRSASMKVEGGERRIADADLAAALARFMQVESAALRAIGLERRAKPVPSLSQYLEARASAFTAEPDETR